MKLLWIPKPDLSSRSFHPSQIFLKKLGYHLKHVLRKDKEDRNSKNYHLMYRWWKCPKYYFLLAMSQIYTKRENNDFKRATNAIAPINSLNRFILFLASSKNRFLAIARRSFFNVLEWWYFTLVYRKCIVNLWKLFLCVICIWNLEY